VAAGLPRCLEILVDLFESSADLQEVLFHVDADLVWINS